VLTPLPWQLRSRGHQHSVVPLESLGYSEVALWSEQWCERLTAVCPKGLSASHSAASEQCRVGNYPDNMSFLWAWCVFTSAERHQDVSLAEPGMEPLLEGVAVAWALQREQSGPWRSGG